MGLFEVLPSEFISDFSLVSMPVIDLDCASKCFMMVVDCLSQNASVPLSIWDWLWLIMIIKVFSSVSDSFFLLHSSTRTWSYIVVL